MTSQNARLVLAAALAAGLTTLQHVVLADRPVPREYRYIAGTLAIWAGYLLVERRPESVAALLAASAGAGLPPLVGYARRRAALRLRRPPWATTPL